MRGGYAGNLSLSFGNVPGWDACPVHDVTAVRICCGVVVVE